MDERKYTLAELEENPEIMNVMKIHSFIPVASLAEMVMVVLKNCMDENDGIKSINRVKTEITKYGVFAIVMFPEVIWSEDQTENYDFLHIWGLDEILNGNKSFEAFERIIDAAIIDFENENSLESLIKGFAAKFGKGTLEGLESINRLLSEISEEDLKNMVDKLSKLSDNKMAKKYIKTLLN